MALNLAVAGKPQFELQAAWYRARSGRGVLTCLAWLVDGGDSVLIVGEGAR